MFCYLTLKKANSVKHTPVNVLCKLCKRFYPMQWKLLPSLEIFSIILNLSRLRRYHHVNVFAISRKYLFLQWIKAFFSRGEPINFFEIGFLVVTPAFYPSHFKTYFKYFKVLYLSYLLHDVKMKNKISSIVQKGSLTVNPKSIFCSLVANFLKIIKAWNMT